MIEKLCKCGRPTTKKNGICRGCYQKKYMLNRAKDIPEDERPEKKCKECGKKMCTIDSDHYKGKYCFACKGRCTVRDDELIDDAQRVINVSKLQIKFLTHEKRIKKEIERLEALIRRNERLIKKVEGE